MRRIYIIKFNVHMIQLKLTILHRNEYKLLRKLYFIILEGIMMEVDLLILVKLHNIDWFNVKGFQVTFC